MFGVKNYGEFVFAVIIFLCIPGPGNLALIASTIKGGFQGGIAATFGIIVGDQFLLWLAVAGVAALLVANPKLFAALQYAGAAYLVMLGCLLIAVKKSEFVGITLRPNEYFQQSFFITVLNPKAIVFYMVFLPLFIDPGQQRGLVTFSVLAITVASLTWVYGLTLVMMTVFMAEGVRSRPFVAGRLQTIAGICLLGFGLKLALTR